jgi:hypothetical protein
MCLDRLWNRAGQRKNCFLEVEAILEARLMSAVICFVC